MYHTRLSNCLQLSIHSCWPTAYLAARWSSGFAAPSVTYPIIRLLTSPCIYHALPREPGEISWEPRDLGKQGSGRNFGESWQCQRIKLLEVAGREVDPSWFDVADKHLCPPIQSSVTMKAPKRGRTVLTASSAKETSLPTQGCRFPLPKKHQPDHIFNTHLKTPTVRSNPLRPSDV